MLKILAAGLLSVSALVTDSGAANPSPARFEIPSSGLTFWAQKSFNGPYINYQTVSTGCTNLPFDAWAGLNMISGDQILAYTGPDCTGIAFGFSFHSFNHAAKSFKPR
ncbi:hypothetical protein POL68_04690 [Stigmatella sp. ncwal1]|uniref:Uncharacterized protein n=1 Tax=Stigmatella ashevillensis TaxID=2995309 RepID=A0ABT5D262_9BACT|nr:hypothetical protein [Stigmatella ashevillena]MDC0707759.1 hypothetical protein [Stigmatella ashevillena]